MPDLIPALLALIALTTIVCMTVIIAKAQRLDAERHRDMLDRLMSRDLTEYKAATAEPIQSSGPVDLDDEAEWAREIELMKGR